MERIVIQSTRDNIGLVEAFLSDISDQYHVGNYFATISVAVMQAVENALVHGNKLDSTKQIAISCGHCLGGMFFQVEDQGNGFDFNKYGDFPEQGSGEGIFLIKTLSDRLEYSNNGKVVRMEFDINGIESSDSLERRTAMKRFYSSKCVRV